MTLRTRRIQKGWSQEQLAQLCGLSLRTIQRFEKGENASLETLNSLAAVFEVPTQDLQTPPAAEVDGSATRDKKKLRRARRQVRNLKGFYVHLLIYGLVIALLGTINLFSASSSFWAIWPALGWGCGIAMHGFLVFKPFSVFSSEWTQNQMDKRVR